MELQILIEKYRSKKQVKLFRACSHGADYDACHGTSQGKWKKMEREFSASTPSFSNLPERGKKKKRKNK